MEAARFDRLEAKIDKLADAMIKLTEHSIKLENLVDHNVVQDNRLNRHSETIDQHAIKLAMTAKTSSTNEWFVRILIAALVSSVAFMLRS
jgi:hypothetical protein